MIVLVAVLPFCDISNTTEFTGIANTAIKKCPTCLFWWAFTSIPISFRVPSAPLWPRITHRSKSCLPDSIADRPDFKAICSISHQTRSPDSAGAALPGFKKTSWPKRSLNWPLPKCRISPSGTPT